MQSEGPEGTDGSTGFGSPAWTRAALLALVVLLPLVLALDQGTVVRRSFNAGVANARRALRNRRPDVAWQAADPEHEGLNGAVLDSLRLSLAEGTESFLVVRGNHVVYEWYATGSGPNLRRGTAAMAKAITGTLVALTAATDRRIGLDDPAWKYIPRWHADSIRSKIRIGDLASHHSGMDNVDFGAGRDGKLEGWKKRYYEHRGERFELALDTAPILFPPGTRSSYSGVGYYALAYALAASLKGAPQQDVRTLLRERIMGPLGIPDQDWQLSYGESYQVDGMTLYAIGSGASYTTRAAARVGELFLDRGRWGDRWLLDSGLVSRALAPAVEPAVSDSGPYPAAPEASGGGWALNIHGSWPTVPRDAIAGMGDGQQAILVVPSLDLVMVWMGKHLAPADDFETALRDQLFSPLMRAVIGPSSRMGAIAASLGGP